jgi:drug/metabolite transporter (DMT)-like permease
MNIASALITFVLLALTGIGLFFGLVLALNGFSERDATPAMIFYIAWLVFFALIFSVISFFLTKFLIKKSFNAILAVILSAVVAVGIGGVIDFGGLIVSSIIASEIRNSYIKK